MIKIILTIHLFFFTTLITAQGLTRDELEKQKQQLKKDLELTQKLLNDNQAKSKETYTGLVKATAKVNIQEKIINNINQDINILDNNLVKTQRDINRYDRVLDTLKQEYAKSMVYAYNNRGNYDFINFIFSSSSFNDAIKRFGYLKSYRNYREMQGQNILRTQELRKQRVEELSGNKQKKNLVLKEKDSEMATLQKQQEEKDRIFNQLKKQGKQLNNQLSATRKQLKKVDNAITAAIRKAMDDARKEDAAKKMALKKAANEEANRLAKSNSAIKNNTTAATPTAPTKTTTVTTTVKKETSILLNTENITLNANFINNKGLLPWPVDNGFPIMHFGRNQLESGTWLDMTGITISTQIGTPVKSIFDGTVSQVTTIEDMQVVTVQHGKYFVTYSNLLNVTVHHGQSIQRGQVIGKVAANIDGVGTVDFYVSDEKNFLDPERWLKHR